MDTRNYHHLIDANAPAAALAIDYPHGHVIEAHRHAYAQLLYAIEGVLTVETADGRWVVPPTRGVWLQPEVDHQVRMRGDVKMRTVFVNAGPVGASPGWPGLPQQSCVLEIHPLLRELIVAAVGIGPELEADSRDWHLLRLLVHELRSVPVLPLYLPLPADAGLRAICSTLMAQPDEPTTVGMHAAQLGIATRTFHRMFLRQTGMRFGHWRQQARLLLALEQLARGDKVIDVALAHGYNSQSAFTAMFRRHFGIVPSRFFD
ncbi:helix-turn-helix transcriptional regulator [Herbaspirillum lusitanum]|uniref:Helix-turn-helix transcriptional regulator n=1 Tax=Herbaspirillum lusitanum TaxID=213312 RepID=A0ABW9A284_9BURK